MWISGQLQNAVGLDDNDLEMYGVEGLLESSEILVPEDTRPVLFSVLSNVVSDRCLAELNEHIPDTSTWINVD